jgi:ligand-binding SRPBCC domain-containing protein
MAEFVFQIEQTLASPIERVFAFFGDAGNLEAITPPWLKFRILTPRPIPMRAGAIIDYSLRLHGIPFRWRTEITAWEPPAGGRARFQDEQRRGPYRQWIHEHTFETVRMEDGTEGTVVRDCVRYKVMMGWAVDAWLVRPQLERIFDFRAETTRRLIEGA